MKLSETCRCGGQFTAEDDQRADVQTAITAWRENHPCLPPGEPNQQRQGVGFAATQAAPSIRHPWGHNTQEVRAWQPTDFPQ